MKQDSLAAASTCHDLSLQFSDLKKQHRDDMARVKNDKADHAELSELKLTLTTAIANTREEARCTFILYIVEIIKIMFVDYLTSFYLI